MDEGVRDGGRVQSDNSAVSQVDGTLFRRGRRATPHFRGLSLGDDYSSAIGTVTRVQRP